MNHSENAQIIYLVVLLVAVSVGYFTSTRNQAKPMLQYALVWALIFMVLIIGYSFKERLVSELMPSRAIESKGMLEIRQSSDNHFYLDVLVNDKKIRFLIDTGASSIVLNSKDAVTAGLDLGRLNFNKIYNTANGQVRGASAKIGKMQIGQVVFRDVSVSVNEGELDISLLGMSFLERFSSYKVDGDKLYLEY